MSGTNDLDFRRAVRIMLAGRNLRQGELGERLGMNKQVMSGYLKKKDFRLNTDIVRIAKALDFDVKVIFTDKASGHEIVID